MIKKIILSFWCLLTCYLALSQGDTLKVSTIRATYYSDIFVGRRTSNGEVFSQDKYTAAHKTLPFGTLVLVTNPKTNKWVVVRINDRCPKQGILDMTKQAARTIGAGSSVVTMQVLPPHYQLLWEQQDKLHQRQGMELSDLLAAATAIDKHQELPRHKMQDTVAKADTLHGMYYLEVCSVKNRKAAEEVIYRLPMKYQNLVSIQPDTKKPEWVVLLDIAVPLPEAKEIHRELQQTFPESSIRNSVKSK